MLRINRFPLAWYRERIDRGETFSLARIGDGEAGGILQRVRSTGKRTQMFVKPLLAGLERVILDDRPDVFVAGRFGVYKKPFSDWCAAKRVSREWHNAEVFVDAYVDGDLYPITRVERRIVLVGPRHLESLGFPSAFIRIPAQNAFDVIGVTRRRIETVTNPGDVILIAGGPVAKLLAHWVAVELGDRWCLDVGSVFDPLTLNGITRGYHRKRKALEVTL